jgi:hypothetical protein
MPIDVNDINNIYNQSIDIGEKDIQVFNIQFYNYLKGKKYDTKKSVNDLNDIKNDANLHPHAKRVIKEIIWWFGHIGLQKENLPHEFNTVLGDNIQFHKLKVRNRENYSDDDYMRYKNEWEKEYKKDQSEWKNKALLISSVHDGDDDDSSDDEEDEMEEAFFEAHPEELSKKYPGWEKKRDRKGNIYYKNEELRRLGDNIRYNKVSIGNKELIKERGFPRLPPGWKKKWSEHKQTPYYEIRDTRTDKILELSWDRPPSTEGGSSNKNKNSNRKSHTQKSTKKIKRSKKAKNGKRRTLRKR